MKKRKILGTALLASAMMFSTGCDMLSNLPLVGGLFGGGTMQVNPTTKDGKKLELKLSGGTKADKEKVNKAINGAIVINGQTGTNVLAGKNYEMTCTSGNPHCLNISKVYQDIELTWEIDQTQNSFYKMKDISDKMSLLEFNFPEKGQEQRQFKMRLVDLKYKSVKMAKNQCLEYTLKIAPLEKKYEDIKIADITKVTDGKYDQIDYTLTSPYFKPNLDNEDYHYVNAVGEIIYAAPDGNWGLLQDGNDTLEFYAGNAVRSFTESNWVDFKVGKKVAISGNLSHYKGNIQLGFVTAIKELSSSASYQPAAATKQYAQLDIASLENGAAESGKHKQAIQGMMNSLKYVEGTIVSGSWKKDGSTMSSFGLGSRCTFDMNVGGKTITIAYDYHITVKGALDNAYTQGIKQMFTTAFGDTTSTFKVCGTIRYNGNDDGNEVFVGDHGRYEIVPFETNHIVKQ